MNMASAVGGSLAPILTGYLLARPGGWELNFWISSVVYLLGLCCWLAIDPVTPLARAKPEGELA
jgi:MFS family permease